jgi:hypothetical protein
MVGMAFIIGGEWQGLVGRWENGGGRKKGGCGGGGGVFLEPTWEECSSWGFGGFWSLECGVGGGGWGRVWEWEGVFLWLGYRWRACVCVEDRFSIFVCRDGLVFLSGPGPPIPVSPLHTPTKTLLPPLMPKSYPPFSLPPALQSSILP